MNKIMWDVLDWRWRVGGCVLEREMMSFIPAKRGAESEPSG